MRKMLFKILFTLWLISLYLLAISAAAINEALHFTEWQVVVSTLVEILWVVISPFLFATWLRRNPAWVEEERNFVRGIAKDELERVKHGIYC